MLCCFNHLLQAIFPDFNWHMSLYKPSLELPEVRKFRPNFVDTGDGTKKMDPMLACRVVVIKWVAQFTHLTRLVKFHTVFSGNYDSGVEVKMVEL